LLGYPQPLPLNFSPYITFPPISSLFFHLPQRFPLNTPPIPHYHYKISISISTIKFLSTNNYSWTHSTMFRVMNSDTLDLGGERRGPTRRGRCRGHRCGHRFASSVHLSARKGRRPSCDANLHQPPPASGVGLLRPPPMYHVCTSACRYVRYYCSRPSFQVTHVGDFFLGLSLSLSAGSMRQQ
jgi:hypothetical protein